MYFPWNALLDGRNMEYVYSDAWQTAGEFESTLQGLLARPLPGGAQDQ
jgi:hypothetical protein